MNVFSTLSKKGTVQSLPNDLLWLRFITQSMFFEYCLILCGMNSTFSFVSKFLNIFEPFLYRLIKFARVDEHFSVGHVLLYRVTASLHILTILFACSWVNRIPVSWLMSISSLPAFPCQKLSKVILESLLTASKFWGPP